LVTIIFFIRDSPFMRSSRLIASSRHLERFVAPTRERSWALPAGALRGRFGTLSGVPNNSDASFPAVIPEGPHPIPSRTRKLRPPGPMVLQGKLCGRVGRRRELFLNGPSQAIGSGHFYFDRTLEGVPIPPRWAPAGQAVPPPTRSVHSGPSKGPDPPAMGSGRPSCPSLPRRVLSIRDAAKRSPTPRGWTG
jgi:hypothetical protein